MAEQLETPAVSQTGLWFGLLGGAAAWTGQLLAASLLSEWGCLAGWQERTWQGLSVVAWLILVASLLATLAAVAALLASGGILRRCSGAAPSDAAGANARFLARAGFYSSALFVVIILAQTLPILFFLGDC